MQYHKGINKRVRFSFKGFLPIPAMDCINEKDKETSYGWWGAKTAKHVRIVCGIIAESIQPYLMVTENIGNI